MVQHSVAILLCYKQFSPWNYMTMCYTQKPWLMVLEAMKDSLWWANLVLRAFSPISPAQSAEPNSRASCKGETGWDLKAGEMREKGFQEKKSTFLAFRPVTVLLNHIFFFFPGERGRTLEKCLCFETVMSIIELSKKKRV